MIRCILLPARCGRVRGTWRPDHCLMPNHVHIVAVPRDADGLSRAFRHAHRHYTGYVNARLRVTGHLWQGLAGRHVPRTWLRAAGQLEPANSVRWRWTNSTCMPPFATWR